MTIRHRVLWYVSRLLLLSLILSLPPAIFSQSEARPSAATLHEWQSRKFGMFIHFGLYSTLGGVWQGKQYSGNYSEQIQSDAHIPEAEYAALAKTFDPKQWNPDAIVRLAREAGMQFIVLTSKHHDGFNLFATHQTNFNVKDGTPYHRDIVKSLADACARQHMPFGVYYSTIDWHYGDTPDPTNDNLISRAHEEFNVRQLQELATGYGPLTEIWFDMGHPTQPQSRHFADTVHRYQPQCLVSGRVWNSQGDFLEMGDDDIPDYTMDEPWEAPASIFQETWGYRSWQKRTDPAEKLHEHILRLVKVVSHGGNYILNIGPEGNGSVVPYEADVLRGVGAWLKTNGAAIYGTDPQPFHKLDFGYATAKPNRLYLFVDKVPANGKLVLPGMRSSISKAYLLSNPSRSLPFDKTSSGDPEIQFSGDSGYLPVVAVEFDGALRVSQGEALQAQNNGQFVLPRDQAEHFMNLNGEGYYDAPTLRKQKWVFSLPQSGAYKVRLDIAPNHLSRAFDIVVNGKVFSAIVHGSDNQVAIVGPVDLSGRENTISVERAAPAERGEVLDVDLRSVTLLPAATSIQR